MLTDEIDPDWDPQIIAQHEGNRRQIRMMLIHEFGNEEHERKIDDYAALGPAPWSVIDRHNMFLRQIRQSFAFGAYYPALVGACSLGERLLNELVIRLRGAYRSHSATTKSVATHKTFMNWSVCIEALFEWGVLDDPLATKFNNLRKFRNRSVHYGTHLTGRDAREEALQAVLLIQEIIEALFRPHGGPPRFIGGTTGHTFLSTPAESEPFVQEFLVPASILVSPSFDMQYNEDRGWFDVFDDDTYQNEYPTLTDEEFADHRNRPRRSGGK
ncbi:hypothetical protein [Paenarthrobacter ureafaciens]|uniref:hypothetical protein n=2 Tax=Paenarthrobacter ureafaciens TaxID=37931 RepID=UPI001118682D|nr:hypothetical protein [Paenarthrobacter ureafaciens]